MSSSDLNTILKQLHDSLRSHDYNTSTSLLSRAKLLLLRANALIPSPSTPAPVLATAREILELGALVSIRRQDPEAFTRYFQQLQPFYEALSAAGTTGATQRTTRHSSSSSNQSQITGLYLLLLLSQGDYAGFHTILEGLEIRDVEQDEFIQYPVKLEQWLMEGAYDKVWQATTHDRVPSEEYGVFSEVLVGTIRSEIASCSEKAYGSIPIANAKSLLFLDSEGSVIEFAQARGWNVRDGRIYFPATVEHDVATAIPAQKELLGSSQIIENALGYARELETIV